MAITSITRISQQRKKSKAINKQKPLHKILMGFIAILCLLLSSCVIKSQLKHYLAVGSESKILSSSSNATKNSHKSNSRQSAMTTAFNNCQLHDPTTLLTDVAHISQQAQGPLWPVLPLLLSSTFSLLLADLPRLNTKIKLLYIGKLMQLVQLPLFLRHRRLLI